MEKYTKKQRHEIYKKVLKAYLADKGEESHHVKDKITYGGFCYWLAKFCYDYVISLYDFPEITKHEPKIKWGTYKSFWFDPHEKKVRTKILKQAIKETE